MKKIATLKELEQLDCVDDVQVVSDGSYGYIVVLVSNMTEQEKEMIENAKIHFSQCRDDLFVSEAIEGGITGWI